MNVGESQRLYGTYRCPVCGHRDGTELDSGGATRMLSCSYCQSVLEVHGLGAASNRFEAKLAASTGKA